MKAILCNAFGTPDTLVVAEVPPPTPSEYQVPIEGHYAGVNFPDTLMVAGTYQKRPALPFSPGMEVAGVVVAVGRGVRNFRVGDRVLARTKGFGAFAEVSVANQDTVFAIPDNMSFALAAGFSVTILYGSTISAFHWRTSQDANFESSESNTSRRRRHFWHPGSGKSRYCRAARIANELE